MPTAQLLKPIATDWASPSASTESGRALVEHLTSHVERIAPLLLSLSPTPMTLGRWRAPFGVDQLIARTLDTEIIHVYQTPFPSSRLTGVGLRRAVFSVVLSLDKALRDRDVDALRKLCSAEGDVVVAFRLLQILDGLLPIRESEAGPNPWLEDEPLVLTILGPTPTLCLCCSNPGGGPNMIASLGSINDDVVGDDIQPFVREVGRDPRAWFILQEHHE